MRKTTHQRVVLITSCVAVFMFIFAFALVPFYGLICKKTGINTSIPSRELSAVTMSTSQGVDASRTVLVEFVTTNHLNLPWQFYPHQKMLVVHPGETTKVLFFAKNLTDQRMSVQAIPSMTPVDAISHFHKAQCFCFNQQTLNAHESREMALVFTVDRQLPSSVHVITLAYTLFGLSTNPARKQTNE